jgi:DNA-binding MarR family transcriptional regulator
MLRSMPSAKSAVPKDNPALLIPEDHVAFWLGLFPSVLEPTAMRALFAVRALSKQINNQAVSWLAPLGLTPAQYNYLVILRVTDAPCTLNDLSKMIHTSNATVTGMVVALERAKLVKRKGNVEDKRSYLVELTREGRSLVERAFEIHHQNIEAAMAAIPIRERQMLLEIALKVGAGFNAHMADSASRSASRHEKRPPKKQG